MLKHLFGKKHEASNSVQSNGNYYKHAFWIGNKLPDTEIENLKDMSITTSNDYTNILWTDSKNIDNTQKRLADYNIQIRNYKELLERFNQDRNFSQETRDAYLDAIKLHKSTNNYAAVRLV